MSRSTGRRGSILVGVVLMALALYGLAHVLLLLARSAAATAGAYERDVSLRAAAEGAVAEILRDGLTFSPDLVLVRADTLDRWERPPYTTERTLLRLSEEAWLVEARTAHIGGSTFTSSAIAWVPVSSARVAAWPSAVGLGPGASADLHGTVDGDAPPFASVTSAGLGPMTIADIVAHSPSLLAAESPEPARTGGACSPRPSNWGAPTAPDHPCFGLWVVRARTGDSVVRGGEGQGLLAVDGDLVLESTTFHGAVIATGRVTLSAGTRVVGRIVALGGVVSEAGTSVTASSSIAESGVAAGILIWPSTWPLHPARSLGPW